MVPIDTILNRFPRVVRTLAQEQGKNVRLTLEGRDVRVDKSMVELLVDPLMHMVRNAVDHGIEPPDERARARKPPQASVTLGAVQCGGEVQVQVSDDGRGLNEAAILEKAVSRGLTSAATPRVSSHTRFTASFSRRDFPRRPRSRRRRAAASAWTWC